MTQDPLYLPSTKNLSSRDMEHAAEDARHVNLNSPIVQNMIVNMIVARRLYMLARSALDNEIMHGWELDNPGLVIQTLVASAQDKSNEKFPLEDVQRALLGNSVPFIDILIQQQRETGQGIYDEPKKEETTDDGTTSESGETAESSDASTPGAEPDGEVLSGSGD